MSDTFSRVRISDIARRAGVSAGTVDRVLHNRGEVSPKTRTKVLDILQEMNYEPDILASVLASKKTYRFASLIPEATDKSQFWAMPASGFEKALEQVRHFGVRLDPFYFDYFDKDTYIISGKKAIETRPDGMIVSPTFADAAEELISICDEKNIPVVLINSNLFNLPKLSFVGQDSFRSGMVAASLLDFGLPADARILIVNIMSEKGTNTHLMSREEGFRCYYDQPGKEIHTLQTINIHGSDYSSLENALSKVLRTQASAITKTGMFVTNSRVFLAARFLKERGIRNLRLIGYDLMDVNIDYLKDETINFLISQKPIEQGYRSFMTLFDHVVMKKTPPMYQYLPIDIITKENIDYYLNDHHTS
jgi:LacI family transcriptional regulator